MPKSGMHISQISSFKSPIVSGFAATQPLKVKQFFDVFKNAENLRFLQAAKSQVFDTFKLFKPLPIISLKY